MLKLLIVYATTHGQTEKIAKRMAEVAYAEGAFTDTVPVRDALECPLEMYDSLIIAGSIRFGRHQRNMESFIRQKLSAISSMTSALVSVSGAAASPEGTAQAVSYIHRLSRRTGWMPPICLTVAGGEPYTKYGFFTRAVMRSIAKSHGRIVDVRRDYEFTDWEAVDRFARDFVRQAVQKQQVA